MGEKYQVGKEVSVVQEDPTKGLYNNYSFG